MDDLSFVGAALAAKLYFEQSTQIDNCTMAINLAFVVNLFVPKGTPTRRVIYLL